MTSLLKSWEKKSRKMCIRDSVYGVPLDSRKEYTKSDWILWCASMTDDREKVDALIAPIAAYVNETPSRVPFSDWYEMCIRDRYKDSRQCADNGKYGRTYGNGSKAFKQAHG